MAVSMQTRNSGRTASALWRKRLMRSLPWYPFIAVNLLIFFIFNFVAWISLIQTSLFETDLLSTREFVGLDNFLRMFEDEQFHRALLNTVQFALMYVPLLFILSLIVAILVNRPLT